ncbi:MAG: ABC transporter permease [Rhodospirillales bacterium]|nr:ABC transporter permease [Rhodospirillales bacterium]MDH3916680.1 ABC transporter permease [Rhodospirillales bacterium]MDH3965692.1 ABC transporter permease [Rhodospirillales bacterium]
MADTAHRTPRALDLKYQPGFTSVAMLCFFVLYAPIAVLVFFSFNANRSVTRWTEFSLDWYVRALANEGIQNAAVTSLEVAVFATVFATSIATAAALATTRVARYRGMTAAYTVINMPLMVPEIVTAVATLSFFALLRTTLGINFGLGNVMIAHTVFCIPFAYLPIRARLENMDLTLEQAAADLYATPWRTFRRVTLPLLVPGVIAGAMLAFIISLDDVIITMMVAGPGQTTLPIYILGQIRRGVTPEVNAVSTILLAVSILFVTLFFLLGRRRT